MWLWREFFGLIIEIQNNSFKLIKDTVTKKRLDFSAFK